MEAAYPLFLLTLLAILHVTHVALGIPAEGIEQAVLATLPSTSR